MDFQLCINLHWHACSFIPCWLRLYKRRGNSYHQRSHIFLLLNAFCFIKNFWKLFQRLWSYVANKKPFQPKLSQQNSFVKSPQFSFSNYQVLFLFCNRSELQFKFNLKIFSLFPLLILSPPTACSYFVIVPIRSFFANIYAK